MHSLIIAIRILFTHVIILIMKVAFKFLGRLLIVGVLLSSAYLHLSHPQTHEEVFQNNARDGLALGAHAGLQLELPKNVNSN